MTAPLVSKQLDVSENSSGEVWLPSKTGFVPALPKGKHRRGLKHHSAGLKSWPKALLGLRGESKESKPGCLSAPLLQSSSWCNRSTREEISLPTRQLAVTSLLQCTQPSHRTERQCLVGPVKFILPHDILLLFTEISFQALKKRAFKFFPILLVGSASNVSWWYIHAQVWATVSFLELFVC